MSVRTITYIDREAFGKLSKADKLLVYLTWRQDWVGAKPLAILIGREDVTPWLVQMRQKGWVQRAGRLRRFLYRIGKVPAARAACIMQAIKTVTIADPGGKALAPRR